jgi:hypothetical protein
MKGIGVMKLRRLPIGSTSVAPGRPARKREMLSVAASVLAMCGALASLPMVFASGVANADSYVPWPGAGGPGSGLGVQPGLGWGAPGIGIAPGVGLGAPGPGIFPHHPCAGPVRDLIHPIRCM